jgi:transposase
MDVDRISINEKYNILMHGIINKNITETCKLFGISRTIYYRWLKRYKIYGIEGLKNIERSSPKMPNEVPKYIEKEILRIVKKDPMFGARRIFRKMQEDGFCIGESGIYNVLKRNKLNSYHHRLEFSDLKSLSLKKEEISDLENLLSHTEDFHPGYIFIQSTNYIGRFKNIGRVYQMVAIDYFSRFAFIKIYTNKKSVNSKDILETRVIPTIKHFDIKVKNIITNKSSEFTTGWKLGRHQYEEFLKEQHIAHFYMGNDMNNELYKILKKFQETVYKSLFEDLLKKTMELTLEDLEEAVKCFLQKYNLEMPLGDGINKDKTPLEVINKDKGINFPVPLWLLIHSVTNE